jgi:uncharacterized protein (TIGR00730 family)
LVLSQKCKPTRICVFCSANSGGAGGYTEFAERLGTAMAWQGIGLVWGGSRQGLMGSIARAAQIAGGWVTGIILADSVDKERAAGPNTELYVAKTMHERKSLMYQLSDGFVVLPGGFGTMEQFLEITAWAKLGRHRKPITLANVGGYFDAVLEWLDRAVADGFVTAGERRLVRSADTSEEVLGQLRSETGAAELPLCSAGEVMSGPRQAQLPTRT